MVKSDAGTVSAPNRTPLLTISAPLVSGPTDATFFVPNNRPTAQSNVFDMCHQKANSHAAHLPASSWWLPTKTFSQAFPAPPARKARCRRSGTAELSSRSGYVDKGRVDLSAEPFDRSVLALEDADAGYSVQQHHFTASNLLAHNPGRGHHDDGAQPQLSTLVAVLPDFRLV
ncbi:hypothetical protein KL907_004740 [Ogataea polymorpha]|nr:hypothetical protein KL907_004740 [Ogataea polymorpha]